MTTRREWANEAGSVLAESDRIWRLANPAIFAATVVWLMAIPAALSGDYIGVSVLFVAGAIFYLPAIQALERSRARIESHIFRFPQ